MGGSTSPHRHSGYDPEYPIVNYQGGSSQDNSEARQCCSKALTGGRCVWPHEAAGFGTNNGHGPMHTPFPLRSLRRKPLSGYLSLVAGVAHHSSRVRLEPFAKHSSSRCVHCHLGGSGIGHFLLALPDNQFSHRTSKVSWDVGREVEGFLNLGMP